MLKNDRKYFKSSLIYDVEREPEVKYLIEHVDYFLILNFYFLKCVDAQIYQ